MSGEWWVSAALLDLTRAAAAGQPVDEADGLGLSAWPSRTVVASVFGRAGMSFRRRADQDRASAYISASSAPKRIQAAADAIRSAFGSKIDSFPAASPS